jgi:lysophospholipase L1-like esterase
VLLTTGLAVALGLAVFSRVRDSHLDLATGLLFIGSTAFASLGVAELLLALVGASRHRTGVRVLIATTGVLWAVLEIFLRYGLGTYTTYLEANERSGYRSLYEGTAPTWYHVYSPNIEYTHKRVEFAYQRTTNSLGLPEREIPREKASDEYRIIALGDSFTEGIGAPYDEAWIKVVEKRLAATAGSHVVSTLNAGVSGSDPWYEYMLLEHRLLDADPDLVIVAINTSDISDTMMRGGRERFQPGGTTRFTRQPPAWEWLYGISFLTRHVVHGILGYDSLFLRERDLPAHRAEAIDRIVEAVSAFATLSRERHFGLLIVLHPDHWEGTNRTYSDVFASLVARVTQLPGVNTADVLARWKAGDWYADADVQSLYWPLDGHNSPEGYEALGRAVADRIVELGLIGSDPPGHAEH